MRQNKTLKTLNDDITLLAKAYISGDINKTEFFTLLPKEIRYAIIHYHSKPLFSTKFILFMELTMIIDLMKFYIEIMVINGICESIWNPVAVKLNTIAYSFSY